jgi:hypothetical protein
MQDSGKPKTIKIYLEEALISQTPHGQHTRSPKTFASRVAEGENLRPLSLLP